MANSIYPKLSISIEHDINTEMLAITLDGVLTWAKMITVTYMI